MLALIHEKKNQLAMKGEEIAARKKRSLTHAYNSDAIKMSKWDLNGTKNAVLSDSIK